MRRNPRSGATDCAVTMTSPIEPRTGSDWSRDAGHSGPVPVAHAGLGEQVPGPGRIVFQLAPEPGHVEPQVVGARLVSGSPDPGQQLTGADQLAGPPGQALQDPPLGRGQPHRFGRTPRTRVPDDGVRGQVDDTVADHHRRGPGRGRVVPAQRRPQPGQQLGHGERLGHVVVGPHVEGADLVARAGPAGEHDDRGLGPAPQLDDDLGAVDVRQPQVEDHRVRGALGRAGQRLPSTARGDRVVLAGPQVDEQGPEQARLILDQEDPGPGPGPGCGPGRGGRVHRFDSWSSAMLRVSTSTRGSPRKPAFRPWVNLVTRPLTAASLSPRALATRSTWIAAYCGEMSGSRPEPEAVTASGGTCDAFTPSNEAIAALRCSMVLVRSGLSGPRLEAPEKLGSQP